MKRGRRLVRLRANSETSLSVFDGNSIKPIANIANIALKTKKSGFS